MKNLLFGLSLCLLPFMPAAQQTHTADTAQSKPALNYAREEYCALYYYPTNSDKITVKVDYGKISKNSITDISDEHRKPIQFNSIIDALNYMARKGWVLVTKDNLMYIMRRPLTD